MVVVVGGRWGAEAGSDVNWVAAFFKHSFCHLI